MKTTKAKKKSLLPEVKDDFEDDAHQVHDSEDEDVDEDQHARMLDAISSMGGKKRSNHSVRTEAAPVVSEFHSNASHKVDLDDLVGSLQQTTALSGLRKQLDNVQKRTNVLPTPLPKNEQQKIERSVAYSSTSKEMDKWEPVVEKNRKAEQLYFPLSQPNMRLQTSDQFVKRFQPRTPLEMEVAALLHGSESDLPKERVLTKAEERALRAMSLEEAKERRAELQKYRALLSYKEAKARRQKKIKSKKFHRILRKEKTKQELKELDDLKSTNPEEYLEKLKTMDKSRIQERMSLKHKTGSKFMKRQKMYSKHDEGSRQQVMDMLEKNKELTKKVLVESDESEEEGLAEEVIDEEPLDSFQMGSSENPWMSVSSGTKRKTKEIADKQDHSVADNDHGVNKCEENVQMLKSELSDSLKTGEVLSDEQGGSDEESDDSDDDSVAEEETELSKAKGIDEIFNVIEKKRKDNIIINKKKQEQQRLETVAKQKEKIKKKNERNMRKTKEYEVDTDSDSDEELISESLNRKRTLQDIEDGATSDDYSKKSKIKVNSSHDKPDIDPVDSKQSGNSNQSTKKTDASIDPAKLLVEGVTVSHSQHSNLVTHEDDNIDVSHDDNDQRMTIAQAFADDDVIAEFKDEKKAIVNRDNPKAIDLTLPGWGDWGGTGVIPSKRKRKRFLIKPHPAKPRQDKNMTGVIISEVKDSTIAKHQVDKLPFPFADVKQFESSIRSPIGRTWNPETAYRQLIKPKVVTKLGSVIEPIDKTAVFKKQGKQESGNAFQEHGKNKKKNKGKKNKKQ